MEGFGETRADLRMGISTAVLANLHRDPKTRPDPYRPEDFMPRLEADPEEEARAKQRRLFSRAAGIFGAIRAAALAKEAARGDD